MPVVVRIKWKSEIKYSFLADDTMLPQGGMCLSEKTIRSMVRWIDNNITDDPTLQGMSNHVGYSPCYCSAKFHETLGVSFKQYLCQRRLSLAAAEVRETPAKLMEIAVKYGYLSQEAFTRAFADAYGCTPRAYRRQQGLCDGVLSDGR